MVPPSARVLEVVVDGGRPVLPGAPVGRDRALDGGRERGDLGEDFGAGTALFRWFLFHAYIIIYAYAKIKREMWGGCINLSVHPSDTFGTPLGAQTKKVMTRLTIIFFSAGRDSAIMTVSATSVESAMRLEPSLRSSSLLRWRK